MKRRNQLRVLGFACSPRADSRSEKMLKKLFSHFPADLSAEMIALRKKRIAPCEGCVSYGKGERCKFPCVHADDTNEILEAIIGADILVFSSPVYWGSPSSLFHILKEKMTALENNSYEIFKERGREPLQGKPYILLASQDTDGAALALSQVAWAFSHMGMLLIPYGLIYRHAILERRIARWGLRLMCERRHEWVDNTIRLCARNLIGVAERMQGFEFDDYKVIEPRD